MRNMRFRAKKAIAMTLLLTFILIVTIHPSGAVTWSAATQLTYVPEAWDEMPSAMRTSDGTIWVIWASDREGLQYDLFYKTSSNNGLSWSGDTPVVENPGVDEMPSIMQASDGTIWVVWSSYRTGDHEIFYKTSSNNGLSWSGDTRLTTNPGRDADPYITQLLDGRIWVIWHRDYEGNYDLFYKTSSNNGLSWSGDTRLTTNPSYDLSPSITQTWDGMIWVVWSSYRTGDYEIFYKTSSNNGLSWSGDTRLTTDTANFDQKPVVTQAVDGSIWVVWASGAETKTDDVYYKTTLNYGATWSESIQLTTDANDDTAPSILNIPPRNISIFWASYRTDDFEIFYKISDKIPIHDVAVTDVTPHVTWIFREEIVPTTVVVENQGTENEIFEVSCYANTTLIATETVTLTNGTSTTLDFFWNTEGTAIGEYVISATAIPVSGETTANSADNTFVDGTVEVKILGDVNEDGIVDLDDVYLVSGAFGTTPGMPRWDPRADVALPYGFIDLADMYVVISHFGET